MPARGNLRFRSVNFGLNLRKPANGFSDTAAAPHDVGLGIRGTEQALGLSSLRRTLGVFSRLHPPYQLNKAVRVVCVSINPFSQKTAYDRVGLGTLTRGIDRLARLPQAGSPRRRPP